MCQQQNICTAYYSCLGNLKPHKYDTKIWQLKGRWIFYCKTAQTDNSTKKKDSLQ